MIATQVYICTQCIIMRGIIIIIRTEEMQYVYALIMTEISFPGIFNLFSLFKPTAMRKKYLVVNLIF